MTLKDKREHWERGGKVVLVVPVSDTVYVDRVHTRQKYKPVVVDKMYLSIMEILKNHPEIDLDSLCQKQVSENKGK